MVKGVLKTWKEDRGFGFISPDNGSRDVFIHISALGETSRRPIPGDIVHYQLVRDRNGKYRAINASIEGVTDQNKATNVKPKTKPIFIWVIMGMLILLAIITALLIQYR